MVIVMVIVMGRAGVSVKVIVRFSSSLSPQDALITIARLTCSVQLDRCSPRSTKPPDEACTM